MSNCKQKFLGLDSIDVLIKYIDSKIEENSSDIRVCTLQLFKYLKSNDDINYPSNDIFYDFDTSTISFPNNYEDSLLSSIFHLFMKNIVFKMCKQGLLWLSNG